MTILSVVQTFCQRTGLPVPATIASTLNSQVIQILALANEVVEDLVDRWTWTDLMQEAVFTTIPGDEQGALTALAPNGFLRISQETIYNRTLRLPLFGPLTQAQWQNYKALPTTGPYYTYRIRQGKLYFNPDAIAGHICAFEYATSLAVLDENGLVFKPAFSKDGDTFLLSEVILQAGLRWKWKSEKGLDYSEEIRRYEELANNASGRDGTKPRLNMGESLESFRPGIWVPAGNWGL